MRIHLAAIFLTAVITGQAAAERDGVVLEGRWTTERSETVCLVHEANTIIGFDEPGSTCPDGTQREKYIENGKLDSRGFGGVMYLCNPLRLIDECKHDSVWGPVGFHAPDPTSESISGTRRGEYFVKCKLTKKDERRDFSLTRVGACNLDGGCTSIEAMQKAIDPGRRERLAARLETLRQKLVDLRKQVECLTCEGHETRTQSLLGDLLRGINEVSVPASSPDALMPLGADTGTCFGYDSQECAQVKALYRVRTTLEELGSLLGCWPPPPTEGASPAQCVYNCINAKTVAYLIKKQLKKVKAVKDVLSGRNCEKCRQGDLAACATCINGVTTQVPGISEAVDIGKCVQECSACPEDCPYEHVCDHDVGYCSFGTVSRYHSRCTIRCNKGSYQWKLIHECVLCSARSGCRLVGSDSECFEPGPSNL